MTPEVKDAITASLKSAGFSVGKKFGSVEHGCGLPPYCVTVEPKYTPIDGGAVIVVTATTAQMWVCRYPWAHHDWCPHGIRHEYESEEELQRILPELINGPKGCWAAKKAG